MKLQGHAKTVTKNKLGETEKPIRYITHFATEQEKFRVVNKRVLNNNDVCYSV